MQIVIFIHQTKALKGWLRTGRPQWRIQISLYMHRNVQTPRTVELTQDKPCEAGRTT